MLKGIPLFKCWKYRDWSWLNSNPWLIWLFCLVLPSDAPFNSRMLDLKASIGDSCGLRLIIWGDPCLLSISSSSTLDEPFVLKWYSVIIFDVSEIQTQRTIKDANIKLYSCKSYPPSFPPLLPPPPLWGLLRWYSTSSTVHTAPFTFSTLMKHLWRDKLWRTAF